MLNGITLSSLSVLFMASAIFFAAIDNMLSPFQMQNVHHIKVGFPLVSNGAIWGNLILISVALSIIGTYASQWGKMEIVAFIGAGLIVSWLLFHFVYLTGKFPDALAGGGRDISPAGWVVMIYSGIVYALIGLFYFRTNATQSDILIVGTILALYIPVANHAMLSALNSYYHWSWCPDVFAEESSPLLFIIGGEIAVMLATFIKLDISW